MTKLKQNPRNFHEKFYTANKDKKLEISLGDFNEALKAAFNYGVQGGSLAWRSRLLRILVSRGLINFKERLVP